MATDIQLRNLEDLRRDFRPYASPVDKAAHEGRGDFYPNGGAPQTNRYPEDTPEGEAWRASNDEEARYGTMNEDD